MPDAPMPAARKTDEPAVSHVPVLADEVVAMLIEKIHTKQLLIGAGADPTH